MGGRSEDYWALSASTAKLSGSVRIRSMTRRCRSVSMSWAHPSAAIAHQTDWDIGHLGHVRGLMMPKWPIVGG